MSGEQHVIHEPVVSVTAEGEVIVTQDEEHDFDAVAWARFAKAAAAVSDRMWPNKTEEQA